MEEFIAWVFEDEVEARKRFEDPDDKPSTTEGMS
jgi:hypothetical protein